MDLQRIILLVSLLMLTACGGGEEGEVSSVAANYHLDPPDLANLLISEIEPGVPVSRNQRRWRSNSPRGVVQ
ncbi:hypothetical protein DRQ50_13725, partial [bacterium]